MKIASKYSSDTKNIEQNAPCFHIRWPKITSGWGSHPESLKCKVSKTDSTHLDPPPFRPVDLDTRMIGGRLFKSLADPNVNLTSVLLR